MKVTLNIEGELVGINTFDGTALILVDDKTLLYPIKELTVFINASSSPIEI